MANNKKILLTICPMWDVSIPPIGSAYLAAYLERRNITVDILDINIETYVSSSPERKEFWKMENYNLWAWENLFAETKKSFEEDIDYYVNKILNRGYSAVGFSLYGANTLFSIEIAERLKQREPRLFIIFGGPSCSFLHEHSNMPVRGMVSFRTQKSLVKLGVVDAFVIGEGEESIYKLVNLCFSGKTYPLCNVVLYKHGRYSLYAGNSLIENLDETGYPVWDKLPLKLYSSGNTLPILFSRGCINKCSFCNDWKIWQGRYRCRSALNIFEELKVMSKKFDAKVFQCNDLLFNGNLRMLEELADCINASDINIQWSAQGIVRRDLGFKLLEKLKRSGLTWVTYGVESLSEDILNKMGKKFTYEDIKSVLKQTKKAQIAASINFIIGFPGETEEYFNLTKSRLKEIKEYVSVISSLNPCYVTGETDLEKAPQKFSITLPGQQWWYSWESLDGKNTYEIRKRRTEEFLAFATKIGMKTQFVGIYNEQISSDKCLQKQDEINKDEKYKVDFLFINLPPWGQENPHIGIGYISSYLRTKEVSFKVLDLNKSFFTEHPDFRMLWHTENKNFWSNKNTFPLILDVFCKDIEDALRKITEFNPRVVGFSVVDPKERLTVEFIEKIKIRLPGVKIILGGPAASTSEQRQLFLDKASSLIDIFVVGEGEEVCFNILNRMINKESLTNIAGTVVKCNEKWIYTAPKPIDCLEKIPFPTYEEFNVDLYGKSLLVEWSRGCYSKCAFCKNWRLFPFYRAKSPLWVIEELKYHNQVNGISEFTVVDSVLNGSPKQLYKVCSLIIRENLGISWSGQIIPRRDMTADFFSHMARAGCKQLQIGVESGSNNVLKYMGKSHKVEIAEYTLRNAKKAGIETEIFILIGCPGEDAREFKKTYNFVKDNRRYIDKIKSINTLHLIAGTEVYESAYEKFNMKTFPKENWHYLWETKDGNTYKVRKKRAQTLLDLAEKAGIKVMESNIKEGKELGLERFVANHADKKPVLEIFKKEISNLQVLPEEKSKIKRKKRSIFKWILLISLSSYVFLYILYFWVYMYLTNKALLGGRRNKKTSIKQF